MLDIAQIANHPVITERGALQKNRPSGDRSIASPKSPFRMSETPAMIRDRAPFWANTTEKILSKYLGYSAEKIADLSKGGILVQEPRVAGVAGRRPHPVTARFPRA